MSKGKTFWTKNNPKFIGKVVSDTPKADMSNTLPINSDGYGKEVEVKNAPWSTDCKQSWWTKKNVSFEKV